jgi:hypothetical protein
VKSSPIRRNGGYKPLQNPKLSWRRPRRVQRPKSMPNVLGRRPIPNGVEIALWTSQEVHKSHSGPLQPRPTHTPSRRCAPCSLACFHFFFRELPLLSRPRPAQPLLLTADSAGSSVFLSPIGVTIAAARPCMFIADPECVSAKNACPACASRFDACTC